MKMNIKVNLTYEQTKALIALGMTQFKQNLDDYHTVENRVRSNIDRISGSIFYINENYDEDAPQFLKSIIEECNELFENELVDRYYWNDNFEQKERLIAIKHKAEFLIDNEEEHNKQDLNYPDKMKDLSDIFIFELNK